MRYLKLVADEKLHPMVDIKTIRAKLLKGNTSQE
jgi:hypothetical protein